jgi:hypothetical protein
MKKLLLSGAALLFAAATFAQTVPSRFGIKAGVNLPTYSGSGVFDNVDFKSNTGFHITAFGDFPISNSFYIQPGVSFQNKGAKISSSATSGTTTSTGTWKQSVMAIEVPVNAMYSIPAGGAGAFQITAGPYIGFNIGGKEKTSGSFSTTGTASTSESERDLEFGSDAGDDLKSIDFGGNVGLAFRTNSGFLIGGNYGIGFTNLVPNSNNNTNDKLKNRVLSFSVGFSF